MLSLYKTKLLNQEPSKMNDDFRVLLSNVNNFCNFLWIGKFFSNIFFVIKEKLL